jgi:hypothetical protein
VAARNTLWHTIEDAYVARVRVPPAQILMVVRLADGVVLYANERPPPRCEALAAWFRRWASGLQKAREEKFADVVESHADGGASQPASVAVSEVGSTDANAAELAVPLDKRPRLDMGVCPSLRTPAEAGVTGRVSSGDAAAPSTPCLSQRAVVPERPLAKAVHWVDLEEDSDVDMLPAESDDTPAATRSEVSLDKVSAADPGPVPGASSPRAACESCGGLRLAGGKWCVACGRMHGSDGEAHATDAVSQFFRFDSGLVVLRSDRGARSDVADWVRKCKGYVRKATEKLHFRSLMHRFQSDEVFRRTQVDIGWNEAFVEEIERVAREGSATGSGRRSHAVRDSKTGVYFRHTHLAKPGEVDVAVADPVAPWDKTTSWHRRDEWRDNSHEAHASCCRAELRASRGALDRSWNNEKAARWSGHGSQSWR